MPAPKIKTVATPVANTVPTLLPSKILIDCALCTLPCRRKHQARCGLSNRTCVQIVVLYQKHVKCSRGAAQKTFPNVGGSRNASPLPIRS